MAEQESRQRGKQNDSGEFKSRLVKSFLTPIAAAAASAAAGYAAKKAPAYVERKVLPKLKSAAGEAGGAAQDLPSRAKSVASGAGDVAQELGGRAKSLVSSNGRRRTSRSAAEIARRQGERARARAERRKTRAK
jgi:hypothetical protein